MYDKLQNQTTKSHLDTFKHPAGYTSGRCLSPPSLGPIFHFNAVFGKSYAKQECIPGRCLGGCLPGGCLPIGVSTQRVVSALEGVCLGVYNPHCMLGYTAPLWTEFFTHACENTTFLSGGNNRLTSPLLGSCSSENSWIPTAYVDWVN